MRGSDLGSAYLWLFLTMLAGLCVGLAAQTGTIETGAYAFRTHHYCNGHVGFAPHGSRRTRGRGGESVGHARIRMGRAALRGLRVAAHATHLECDSRLDKSRPSKSKSRGLHIHRPAVIGLSVLVLLPFLFGVCLSFFRFSQGDFSWVGLAHFLEILTNQDYPLLHPLNFYFTLG